MSQLAKSLPEESQEQIVRALKYAQQRGADAAEIAVNQENGFSVNARLGTVETVEHHNYHTLAITVYKGQSKGSASTNDLGQAAIERAVLAALNIASVTAEDQYAGLADAEDMAFEYPDLQLYHPWDLSTERAIDLAIECENAARADDKITNSEGASLTTINGVSSYANTHGFFGQFPSSRHSISCSVIAGEQDQMQRDYWYSVARDASKLQNVVEVGEIAKYRTLRRLGGKQISTQKLPVLFEPNLARGLIGHFVSAIGGTSLYRKASFLVDGLGKQVFPSWMNISENPHLLSAIGSAPFDNEGVKTAARNIVSQGVLDGYVLSSYSARRLGMHTTGNAGGVHNVELSHTDQSFSELLKTMDRGLLVTELIGHGVNGVTGDYSRGASGFWVENGEIQYPVQEITIAGNLSDIYSRIVGIGNDTDVSGNIRCGSILVEEMTLAGA